MFVLLFGHIYLMKIGFNVCFISSQNRVYTWAGIVDNLMRGLIPEGEVLCKIPGWGEKHNLGPWGQYSSMYKVMSWSWHILHQHNLYVFSHRQ